MADVRFGSLADMCTPIGHVRFTPERDTISDIVRPEGGQRTSALPRTFKRRPAPLWRGHRPHRCRDTGQCSLSSCGLIEAGRPADSRYGGRCASLLFAAMNAYRTSEGLTLHRGNNTIRVAPNDGTSCCTRTLDL